MNSYLTLKLSSLMLSTLTFSSYAKNPAANDLEIYAQFKKVQYDLGDKTLEQNYNDKQLYKNVLLQGIKFDAKGNAYVSSATSRWGSKETPGSLAKLVKKEGEWKLQPFPSLEFNNYNNPKGLKAVLGFEIDRNDVMWILDQGHVEGQVNKIGDEKLIAWDLKTNKEIARYEFSELDSDKKCSFLNDLVIDNDAGFIYISDSGLNCQPLKAGIIAYNIKTNTAKRVLSAPDLVGNENFKFQIHGRDVLKANSLQVGINGIALSGDKKTLYWTNMTGNRLMSLPTKIVKEFSKSEQEVIKAAKYVATLPSNTDGMIADRDNNLYMSALTLNGIMRRDARSGNVTVYTSSSDISFVDSLAWGSDGYLYFTSNQLHIWFDGDMKFDDNKVTQTIYRVPVTGKSYKIK